jgi:nickel/cobalt exporter
MPVMIARGLTRTITLLLLVGWLLPGLAAGEEAREVTWADLLPKDPVAFDDPFEQLSADQLRDLAMVARIRSLIENGKSDTDGPNAAEEKQLVAKLEGEGIDVDWLLSQRERVARMRLKRAEAVDDGIDGQDIRIPGYSLPLMVEEGRVTEFLLVPWVGACIHVPPPPPNQMIHVSYPAGAEDRGRFAAVWLEGRIRLEPGNYDLFLVDGTASINVAYTLQAERIIPYSSRESDALSKVDAPALTPDHRWWQNLQTRVSILFTRTMTDIRDRESSGPLWIGVLVAFLYGLVHTLGPGHGKAVVVSYFVGHGGSLARGLQMGTQIAVFHVLSAVVVIWVTDFAVRQATGNAPSDYRLVKLVSYAGIIAIGTFMLWKAIQGERRRVEHTHAHDHEAHQEGGCHACEALARRQQGPIDWLAMAVGAVPCTGALLVLLFGMANNLLGPAILMVVAISVGMAVAMSGIGILAILGRRSIDRRLNEERRAGFASRARIAAAALVFLIGSGLFSMTLIYKNEPMVGNATHALTEPGVLEVLEVTQSEVGRKY